MDYYYEPDQYEEYFVSRDEWSLVDIEGNILVDGEETLEEVASDVKRLGEKCLLNQNQHDSQYLILESLIYEVKGYFDSNAKVDIYGNSDNLNQYVSPKLNWYLKFMCIKNYYANNNGISRLY